MKRFFTILSILALLAVSCHKEPEPNRLAVSPLSLSFTGDDPSSQTLSVTATADWSVKCDADWCRISPSAGKGDGTAQVQVSDNPGAARSATITIESTGCRPKTVSVSQNASTKEKVDPVSVVPQQWDGVKRGAVSYQLLVYSFADSNGDGIGDFNGIAQHLDYLDQMGVQALWLSPIHPASSYHGYDVLDYQSVNSRYGTEEDFRNLVAKAHDKGIRIYLDFVLNHTSKDHPWFLEAKKSETNAYRDYYIFSNSPQADITAGKVAMIASEGASGYDSGQWFSTVSGGAASSVKVRFTLDLDTSGKPKALTVEKVDSIVNQGSQNTGIYLYYGDAKMVQFYNNGGTVSVALDLDTSWGVLVRTSTTSWDGGTKYGAPSGRNKLSWGTALTLSNSSAQDILMPDMNTCYYHSHMWTAYFADLNYGAAATCETSPAFKAVTAAADKWIAMGVDGFRLDAIKHIYHNAAGDENPTFLGKFYDHCNASYKAAGHTDDIYMVGEHFSDASEVAPYYKGLPAFFEFSFWWKLRDAVNNGSGSSFASSVQEMRRQYAQYRSNPIAATKLSNHDEVRAANDLGRSLAKEKLAAAVLLTMPGEPYVYQGEELGYWGVKDQGDEYVRTPMKWTRSGAVASGALSGKVDATMLTPEISVEAQMADGSSLLQTYLAFSKLRNTLPALAGGTMEVCKSTVRTIGAWYLTSSDGQKAFVVHNFGSTSASFPLGGEDVSRPAALNGTASVKTLAGSRTLEMGPYSSVVFVSAQ